MEDQDEETKPMVDPNKEPDQWDKYSYLDGIDRKEFKAAPWAATFRERNQLKDGKFYFQENGYDESMARDENFFKSLCLCACPYVGWLKFITIISFVEIFVFFLEIVLKPKDEMRDDEFLEASPNVMDKLGWQDAHKIKHHYQVWRWFTPILLHGSFQHLAANLLGQLVMGSNIENGISTKYMAFLYIISGFGGNLLSSVLNPTSYGVGASTAVYGLVGFYFQYIFTHWDFMGYDQPKYYRWTKLPWCQRVFLICFVLIFIAVSLAGSIGYERVDQYAHAGGLVTGFFAGIAICEWLDQEAKNKGRAPSRFRNMSAYESRVGCDNWFCHWCGTLFLVAWLVTLISVFYLFTVVDDTEYYDNIEVNYTPPDTPKNEAE